MEKRPMTQEEREEYHRLTENSEQLSFDIEKMNPGRVFGYCRISTPKQSIERQIRNILALYPSADIIQEVYTGKEKYRPKWQKLLQKVQSGDTIVFDSVSRMSRNAEDGIETYFKLYDQGVNLVFLKEQYINTSLYRERAKSKIELLGTKEDIILNALNEYIVELAKEQICIAFNQSEKEVLDLSQRTKEGLVTAKLNGKQLGHKKGTTYKSKREAPAKEIIMKHSKMFGGSLTDKEVMELAKLSHNTYYKYKKELVEMEYETNNGVRIEVERTDAKDRLEEYVEKLMGK